MKHTILIIGILFSSIFANVGNYFLDIAKMSEVDSLAMADFLVLDMEMGRFYPEVLDSLRKVNPDIIIIAYQTMQEIGDNATSWNGSYRASLFKGIDPSWFLKDTDGNKIVFWPGTSMLNVATEWNQYYADFMVDSVYSTGLWDGIYFDNCWENVDWVSGREVEGYTNGNVDIDNDGSFDEESKVNSIWKAGANELLSRVRSKVPEAILVGNGGYGFKQYLNGVLIEIFPIWGGYPYLVKTYLDFDSSAVEPQYNLINSATENSGDISLQKMRLGYTATLMGDGYFSYDYGDEDHSQLWWFDEYDIELGNAVSKAEITEQSSSFEAVFTDSSQWEFGSWKVSSSLDNGKAHLSTTGEEEWNNLLTSTTTFSFASNQDLSLSLDLTAITTENASLYLSLKKGDTEIWIGEKEITSGEQTLLFSKNSGTNSGDGWTLILGIRNKASITLEPFALLTDEILLYSREYENAVVFSNGGKNEITFSEPSLTRFVGVQDQIHNNGESASSVTLAAQDGIILLKNGSSIQETNSLKTVKPVEIFQSKSGIQFENNQNFKTVSLYSLSGKKIHSQSILGVESVQIKSSHLSAGNYLLRLTGTVNIIQKISLE